MQRRFKTPLSDTHPSLAAQWHPTRNEGLTSDQVTAGSRKKVWWQHTTEEGVVHEWEAPVKERTRGSGCAVCVGRQIQVGVNDLATVDPALAADWHPTLNGDLTAAQVTAGSNKKVWWKHTFEDGVVHEWQAAVFNRTNGNGCAVCVGRQIQQGINDLATVSPSLAAQWHPKRNEDLNAEQVTRSSNKKVWWKHTTEDGAAHEWQSTVNARSAGHGCPVCAGRKV